MHWAASLIGKPWSPAGEGPASFNCWNLVRYVFREQYGVAMPAVANTDDNVSAIKRAAGVSGWRRAEAPAQDGDIVLLRGLAGARHVGFVIGLGSRAVLLHANGCLMPDGRSVGCVEAEPLSDVLLSYREPEYWRRA